MLHVRIWWRTSSPSRAGSCPGGFPGFWHQRTGARSGFPAEPLRGRRRTAHRKRRHLRDHELRALEPAGRGLVHQRHGLLQLHRLPELGAPAVSRGCDGGVQGVASPLDPRRGSKREPQYPRGLRVVCPHSTLARPQHRHSGSRRCRRRSARSRVARILRTTS